MYHPHPVVWLREHPRAADGLLTLMVVTAALFAHLTGQTSVDDPDQIDPTWWTVLLVLVGTVPVYWQRTHSLVAGLVVVTAEVFALFIGVGGAAFFGSVVAVYSIGAHTSGITRTRVMSATGVFVALLVVAGWIDGLSLLDEFTSTGALLITAFVLGYRRSWPPTSPVSSLLATTDARSSVRLTAIPPQMDAARTDRR